MFWKIIQTKDEEASNLQVVYTSLFELCVPLSKFIRTFLVKFISLCVLITRMKIEKSGMQKYLQFQPEDRLYSKSVRYSSGEWFLYK